MEIVWKEFEAWWKEIPADNIVLQTKKSVAAMAFKAGKDKNWCRKTLDKNETVEVKFNYRITRRAKKGATK